MDRKQLLGTVTKILKNTIKLKAKNGVWLAESRNS